ncbi:thiosulfate sulfurtransferase PspE precursor [mine drainage metagenome]|uniref:Thiosulfate sulfurtransferase PspE n=1 Tax=mine drainage metagenome TaxID=410659 RepID=A0A1J5PK14_9ZZZZ
MNWFNDLFSGAHPSQPLQWNTDAVILDVRTPDEFASGHVDGAINVPLSGFAQAHAKAAPDKSRQVIVYCQSGARSGQAMLLLKHQGYSNVINGGSPAAVATHTRRTLVR